MVIVKRSTASDDSLMPIEPPTAEQIREFLERHGMSQRQLARLSGSNERTVRNWVTDPNNAHHRGAPRLLWLLFEKIDESTKEAMNVGPE